MKEICKETLAQAYLFLDHEVLSEEQRREIAAHLEECAPCYERVGLEAEVKQLLLRLKGVHTCPDGLKARIKHLLDQL
jgi:mycothiol system anti-sigma-R factor